MANVHEIALKPNEDAMRAMLYALFRSAIRGMVEVGWTAQNGDLNQARQFDVGELDELVTFAARRNLSTNCNVYVSAGLRRPDIDHNVRASDDDVIAIVALKVDCDTSGCLERALRRCEEIGLRPSLIHFSGKHPELRGALWWILDEPTEDKARVRAIEVALAAAFGSDPKVVNASRVMRLAGSVAWPIKAGRVLEMTGALDAPTRPAPYSVDELESAIRRAGLGAAAAGAAGSNVLDFSSAAQALEIEDLVERAHKPNDWHEAMLKATAHLLGRGTPPEVIIDVLAPRVTMQGYAVSQTRRELAVMIRGGLSKGWFQPFKPDGAASGLQASPAGGRDPFPLIAYPDIGLRGPPEWRVVNLLPKRGTGVLYGPSGTYKSFITIDLALTIASGFPWRGQAVEACPAAYIAAEDAHGVEHRVAAWRANRGAGATDAPFWLAPVAANFLDPATVKLVAERLLAIGVKFIVVDTLAKSFYTGDENSAQDMGRFVAACDYLKDTCDAFVLTVHHTGLEESRERGSTALRGGVDVRLGVSKGTGDKAAVIHVAKQKNAEDGQRYRVRMAPVDVVHPVTGEVSSSLIPVVDEEAPAPDLSARLGRNERSVMSALADAWPLRFGAIKAATGMENGTLGRALRSLQDKNFIIREGEDYRPMAEDNDAESEC